MAALTEEARGGVLGKLLPGIALSTAVAIVSVLAEPVLKQLAGGKVGIPAKSDVQLFFFGGPRLYPFIGTTNVIAAFIIVMLVSALSSFYPAWLAMRVTPRQAMAEDEG